MKSRFLDSEKLLALHASMKSDGFSTADDTDVMSYIDYLITERRRPTSFKDKLYHLEFEVIRVIDGDSAWGMVDMGMRQYSKENLRFYGIDTPEMNTLEGKEAKLELMTIFDLAKEPLWMKSHGEDKYGRWLAEIFIGDDSVSVNQTLLKRGLAVPYAGGKRAKAKTKSS